MRCLVFVLSLLWLLSASAPLAQTTVQWWQFWTDPGIRPTIVEMVSEFEQQNPDIKVNLTDLTWASGHEKIVLAFASGTAPDVVELGSDWIAQFADAGRLADLTDHAGPQRPEYQGWSMATYEDRVYAKPWILGTRVLYFNRDLLTRAGFAEDFVPLSFQELDDAVTRIQALSGNVYGWGSNTPEKHRLYKKFLPFFWSARARLFSDDGRFCVVSSQKAVDALKFYKKLHDCCGYVADQRGLEDAFLDGKIGFILSGDWLLKRIELENRKMNFGTSLVPAPDPTFGTGRKFVPGFKTAVYPGRSFEGGEFLAVSATSRNRAAALKLIDFVTSPENQIRFCKANRSANPSSRTAQGDEYFQSHPQLQTFVMQLNLANHPPVDPNWVYMETEIEKAVEEVIFNNALPGETLRQLNKTLTGLLEK